MKHDKRIKRLEKLFAAALDQPASLRIDPDFLAIEEEYSSMQGSISYHGGVKIEPRDEALEFYGRPYTHREYCELAISRGLQKRGYSSSEIAELMDAHLALFEEAGHFDEDIGGGGSRL